MNLILWLMLSRSVFQYENDSLAATALLPIAG